MSKRIKDGGRAFPSVEPKDKYFTTRHHGMTLRQWYKGQIAAGVLATGVSARYAAEAAAACADLLIAEDAEFAAKEKP